MTSLTDRPDHAHAVNTTANTQNANHTTLAGRPVNSALSCGDGIVMDPNVAGKNTREQKTREAARRAPPHATNHARTVRTFRRRWKPSIPNIARNMSTIVAGSGVPTIT